GHRPVGVRQRLEVHAALAVDGHLEHARLHLDIDQFEAGGHHHRLECGEEILDHLRCLLSGLCVCCRSRRCWYWDGDHEVPTCAAHPAEVFPAKTKAWAGRPRLISVTTPQPNGRLKSIAVQARTWIS